MAGPAKITLNKEGIETLATPISDPSVDIGHKDSITAALQKLTGKDESAIYVGDILCFTESDFCRDLDPDSMAALQRFLEDIDPALILNEHTPILPEALKGITDPTEFREGLEESITVLEKPPNALHDNFKADFEREASKVEALRSNIEALQAGDVSEKMQAVLDAIAVLENAISIFHNKPRSHDVSHIADRPVYGDDETSPVIYLRDAKLFLVDQFVAAAEEHGQKVDDKIRRDIKDAVEAIHIHIAQRNYADRPIFKMA